VVIKASIYYGGTLEDHAAQERVVSFVGKCLAARRVGAKRVAPCPDLFWCLDLSSGAAQVREEAFSYYGIIPNAEMDVIEREQFVFDRRTGELVSLVFDAVRDPRAPDTAVLPARHVGDRPAGKPCQLPALRGIQEPSGSMGRHPDLVRELDGELFRYGIAFTPLELALLLHVIKLRYWPALEYCDDPGREPVVDAVDTRASEAELAACLANDSLDFATCLVLFMTPEERRREGLEALPVDQAGADRIAASKRGGATRPAAAGLGRTKASAQSRLRVVTSELSELLTSPISALPVAPSTRLALRAVGILRAQQLLGMSPAKLLALPGVGQREVQDLVVTLADTGLLSVDADEPE
jgi:hypothetical protein